MKWIYTVFLLAVLLIAFVEANSVETPAAQERHRVAVYMAGEEPTGAKGSYQVLGTELAKAITNSGIFSAVDRTDDILNQISKEHEYQRSGAVSDEQIKNLGEQLGVKYLCVARVSELKDGFYLEARLVDVVTASVLEVATASSGLRDAEEIVRTAQQVAQQLVGQSEKFEGGEMSKTETKKASNDETVRKEAEYLNSRGKARLKSNANAAVAFFSKAIEMRPDVAEYYINRGRAYSNVGLFDEATKDFELALRIEPENREVAEFLERAPKRKKVGNAKNMIGVRLGSMVPFGFSGEISYQRILKKNQRVELGASFAGTLSDQTQWATGIGKHVRFNHFNGMLFTYQKYGNIADGFNWYAGLGVDFGLVSLFDGGGETLYSGIGPQLGLEYSFLHSPFAISLDTRPMCTFVLDPDYNLIVGSATIGLSFHYKF
jgi:tetratricopeptide (TPR) repeat protein